jgi:hypothetical protein
MQMLNILSLSKFILIIVYFLIHKNFNHLFAFRFNVLQLQNGKIDLFFSYFDLSIILIGPSKLTESVIYFPSFFIFTFLKLKRGSFLEVLSYKA